MREAPRAHESGRGAGISDQKWCCAEQLLIRFRSLFGARGGIS